MVITDGRSEIQISVHEKAQIEQQSGSLRSRNLPRGRAVILDVISYRLCRRGYGSANNGVANVTTVERRVQNLRNAGVEVEYRRYKNAGHGFGLGVGTDAEGWVGYAIEFWRNHSSK